MKEQKEHSKKFLHFWCTNCQFYWQTDRYEEVENPVNDDYPYIAPCPKCKTNVANTHHGTKNLLHARGKETGPRTEEGKQRASMNAFKTGFYSKKSSMLAPALYKKYAECGIKSEQEDEDGKIYKRFEPTCEYAEQCQRGNLKYCPHQLNLMIKVLAAYQNGDIAEIKNLAGISQGRVHVLLNNFYFDVINEGVTITDVTKGGFTTKAHPLLDQIAKFMGIAGLTSDQQQMNPKNKEPGEIDPKGNLPFDGDPKDFISAMAFQIGQATQKMLNTIKEKKQEEEAVEHEEKQVEVGPAENPFPTNTNDL